MRTRKWHFELWPRSCSVAFRFVSFHRFRSGFYSLPPQRPIQLNQAFHSDLAWWRLYLKAWNGTSMLSTLAARDHDETITTDASGSWDCLAESAAMGFTGSSCKPCSALQRRRCCLSFCHMLSGASTGTENTTMQFQSDNEAVITVITALGTKSCKYTSLMHMLRCLPVF